MKSTLNSALLLAGCLILFGLTNPHYSIAQENIINLDKSGTNCTFQLPDITWEYSGPDHMRKHGVSIRISYRGMPVYRDLAPRGDEEHRSTYRFRSGKVYRVVIRWSDPIERMDSCNAKMR